MSDFWGKPPFNKILNNILQDPVFVVIYFLIVGVVVVELVRVSYKVKEKNYRKIVFILYIALLLLACLFASGIYMIKY